MDLSTGRLFRGTLFHSLNFVIGGIFLPLLITTFLLQAIGDQAYGKWAVMLTLGAWCLFADLGLSLGLPRFVGAAASAGDRERLVRLFSTVLRCYLVVAALGGALIWLLSPRLLATFVKSHDAQDLLALRLVFGVHLALVGCRGVRGFLDGLQRIEATSKVALAIACIQAGCILLALLRGHGLAVIAGIMLAANLLQLLCFLWLLRRAAMAGDRPPLRPPAEAGRGILRQLLGFGLILYGIGILGNVLMSDRLYLGWADLPRAVIANYHLAAVLVGKVAAMMVTFSVALYPAAASLDATQDRLALQRMSLRGLKFHAIVGGILFSMLLAFTPELFLLWTGSLRQEAVLFTRLLTPWGFTSVITCLTAIGAGIGRPGLQLKSTTLSVVLAACLFPLLALPYGARGLALTVSLSVSIAAVGYLVDFRAKLLPLGGRELWVGSLGKPLFACATIVVPLVLIRAIEQSGRVGQGRLSCALLLGLALLIFVPCYFLLGRCIGLLDAGDHARLRAWRLAMTHRRSAC